MTSLFSSSSSNYPANHASVPQHHRRASLINSSGREKARLSPLPSYIDLVEQKQALVARNHGWTTTVFVPSPFPLSTLLSYPFRRRSPSRGSPRRGSVQLSASPPPPPRRRYRVTLPIPPRIWNFCANLLRLSFFRRRRTSTLVLLALLGIIWLIFTLSRRLDITNVETQWYGDPPTLVYSRDDLRKIWLWEIASGHYPSGRKIPDQIGVPPRYPNPGLPSTPAPFHPFLPDAHPGIGNLREYPEVRGTIPDVAYPPRPPPGSVADLDVVMQHCDFSSHKYVRDCLEVLRLGAGIDNNKRVRRGRLDEWRYIYTEHPDNGTTSPATQNTSGDRMRSETMKGKAALMKRQEEESLGTGAVDHDASLSYQQALGSSSESDFTFAKHGLLEPHLSLPPPITVRRPPVFDPKDASAVPDPCDPDHPRIYHMFWAGPFTDKPYLALLSFLFTQNLGLNMPAEEATDYFRSRGVCRPEFWLWVNPSAAAAVPGVMAEQDMYEGLRANPWSSPFLHERFKDVIKFKLWNTTEQLDGIPELKDEWRNSVDTLFNSGGVKYSHPKAAAPAAKNTTVVNGTTTAEEAERKTGAADDDLFNRVGSDSVSSYDRLSVVLSDMARFVLCHRFGGTYLDADTILLRDWEELWGWKGAFAYRWSRLEKYNTAVLRMNKGSALGTFLFRTALRNGLDFHPMTVSRYTKEAHLEGLLLRLPDALFDPAWLNTENYQRDRPPFPYFTEFRDFFDNPAQSSGAPQALGFDGFFKGAYSYHFHNFWWIPFDPSRNWPDLGPRFIDGERNARIKAQSAVKATQGKSSSSGGAKPTPPPSPSGAVPTKEAEGPASKEELVTDDVRDLPWATVLKRTFESYLRGERPNMYGEWILW
ncbi:hypothetical protein CALVIDRAFT_565138 [Calocera viscosa TUFC12733]|uniref:Glycosyltransferase family 32 protein n=1 Tax=Calocera viscosa (strain TUFC12733) TaxID=1330018 RepID=A0A167KUS1_CALVF|nr:hypothetical protein CALVIDRAFT_565138 [Calocera viscosa TUFC12733]